MTVEMNYFVTSNSRPILMQFNTTNSTPQNITCATHTGDQRAKNGMSVLFQNSICTFIPVVVYDIMLLKLLFKQKLGKVSESKVILALAI